MEAISPKKYYSYIILAVFLLVSILSFTVIKPFIIAVLSSLLLAYLFYPVYNAINSRIKNNTLSSFIMVILLCALVIVPSYFAINSLVKESLLLFSRLNQSSLPILQSFSPIIDRIAPLFLGKAPELFLTIPNFLLNLFITLFVLFYFFRDGETLLDKIESMIPLSRKDKNLFIDEFKNITHAVVYGLLLTGILQAIVIVITFYIFDVPAPFLWGFVVLIFSLLPALGPVLVWAPAAVIKYLDGNNIAALGIVLIGALIVTPIESILKSKLIGDKSKLHPIVVVLGVLGGIKFMGLIGVVFGPWILAIFATFVKAYIEKVED